MFENEIESLNFNSHVLNEGGSMKIFQNISKNFNGNL